MVFELRNYLESWLDDLDVRYFKSLKDLMIVDQLKRRVSNDIKDHFLDECGDLVDPLELAGKLDQYESVRSSRKTNHVRVPERKPIERVRPSSPKRIITKNLPKNQNNSLGRVLRPKVIGETKNSSGERCPLVVSVTRLST
ncbi:hypothetical protein AVEN_180408-1 [Araneus ventricosus]|uniref:Uncharacterized protein n=1 Tax=Araneus ventricosus TaxID=182803 RepID=A0A4Y2JH87_ARAVE|nr:hypothetical protein AVEN_180408-1 [Araneus ventricosus]